MKIFEICEDELINFELYGLITTHNDSIRLVYQLNMAFETRFERCEDLEIMIENQQTFFPMFEWEDTDNGLHFNLIKNTAYTLKKNKKSESLIDMFDLNPPLIPDYKKYNFLLKITEEVWGDFPFHENSFIQNISKLKTDKLKMIDRLIF